MAAVEQLITENIDIWSSAVKSKSAAGRGTSNKLELYGIKKLRELILELAVRGLLVPQDPNDEPASVLLEKIAVEKGRLVKENEIKKQNPLPPIEEDEAPFELPVGWEWCRVGDISLAKGGFAFKSKEFLEVSSFQVVRMGNVRPDRFRLEQNPVFVDQTELITCQLEISDFR